MDNTLSRALFPAESRGFPGMRWANITLRTMHLIGISGMGGGYLYGAPEAHWLPYLWVSVVSGGLLAALEVWSNGDWLIQVRGIAVVFKVFIITAPASLGGYGFEAFIAAILISGIVSHAPGSVRYFSIFMNRTNEKRISNEKT